MDAGHIVASLVSTLGIVWTIYAYFSNQREATADKDRKSFLDLFRVSTDLIKQENIDLKRKFEIQENQIQDLKLQLAVLGQKISMLNNTLDESSIRFEKVLEKHDNRLESFGKVKVVK